MARCLSLSSFVWNREIYITNKKKQWQKKHSLKSHHALLIQLVFFFLILYLQLFQTSRSPGPESRAKGPKVVIAKPGSYHRPARAAGPVIGGHRYWQSQMLHSDSPQLRGETRSGRSPRRHSPSYRKTDSAAQQQQQPPATSQPGLLGLPFSKLNHLKHLRTRGATSQKKTSQSNKPAR